MRLKTTAVYQFSELTDRAKDKARDWYRQGIEYDWGHDNMASLKAFASWFDLKIKNYSLGGSDNRSQGVSFEVTIDDKIAELQGVRLWKWFNNQRALPDLSGNCPFTGYCFDETLLDGIRKFLNRPWNCTYEELMQDCIDDFCKDYANDVDYQYSDEAVDESIAANEYEFLEDGSRA